jgi:putative phosphoribosyl transferase
MNDDLIREQQIAVPAGRVILPGTLGLPSHPRGIVIFAHGSGSGRFSPRNNAVAQSLQRAGLATLLIDLLTESESLDRRNVFDIVLLARRLVAATTWSRGNSITRSLPVGYFGASTGGGAAIVAATLTDDVRAVVSRGGRPDLAGEALSRIQAPTLLIVGGNDEPVIELNKEAMARMGAKTELVVIPGATHLFEEPGALEHVAELAKDWFLTYLPVSTPTPHGSS